MSFQKLLAFTKKVADLADQPSGTAAEIKAQFDAAPDELRQSFNSLVDALKSTSDSDSGAKNLGAKAISGLTGTDVQSLIESLKTYFDDRATGGLFGDSNGSQSYASGFQILRSQTVKEMNSNLFTVRDTFRFNILKAGLYAVDINVTRSDLPAGQTFKVGYALNDDASKLWENTAVMGDISWTKSSGPNNTRFPFSFNHMFRANANDYIYFHINSDDGPRNYWYNYRLIRISN